MSLALRCFDSLQRTKAGTDISQDAVSSDLRLRWSLRERPNPTRLQALSMDSCSSIRSLRKQKGPPLTGRAFLACVSVGAIHSS
jgi:hypothetical protein